MASSRPNSGGRAGSGAEPMDWQPDPVAPKANIMVFTVNMSLREAEILLKVGLQREFNEHFKTDATIHADEQGVQIHIPYDIYKASKDEINKFLIGFRRHVLTNRKKLPFHIDLNEVLHLQTVYNKLFDAAANLGAHLEIDMDSKLFWIYALNEDILQNCMKSIQETVKEGLIKIDGIRNELEQDGRWLQFQESLKKQTDDRDFMVQIDGRGILIAGLCDSVEKVYEHLKSITDSLKNGSGDSKKIKKVADYQSQLTDNTSIVEVDFAVESYEAYDYLQAFLIPLLSGNISVKPYEKNNKFGFELVGPSKDIENADVLLKRAVEQMKHIVLKFEDNGYFATSEGKRFLEEEIRHGCKVLFKNPKEGYKKKNNVGKNHRHLSPTRDERDGHGFWRWTIQKGCHIILAESKADEMSAEVVLNMKETKSPDSKLSFQQKQSHQIVSVEVPKYTTGPTLDKLNERLRGVYQRLSQDKLQSVAMSLDCTGSWPIGGLVPKVIRSFSAFLLEKGKGVQLTLLLCSTLTDSIKKAKDVIQRILDEEFKKEENCKKVEPIQVRVVEGLLNKIEADILVNTTASDLDLSNGAVSRSLLKTAGKEMQDEIVNKFSRYIELEPGEITVTKGYKLKCQHVIHGVLEIVEEKQPDSVYKKIIKKFVTDCLEEADGLKCKTIAFPAVGTGRLEYPIDIVASTMFWAVHEFGEDHQRTTLKEVQFVIYPQDQEAIQVFKGKEQEVAEEIKKQQSSVDSAEVVFRFIGPEENIERAKQHIDDRLERLQDAQAKYGSGQDLCTEEINGISYINYELLRNFHMDTLIAWNQQGAVFSWKDEVLKIEGHRKNISVVKAYINSKLNEHVSGLSRAEVDVTGMDKDEIDRILERESPNVVKLYLPVIKAIVICGPVKNLVENEEKQLNKLKTEKARKSEQTQIRDTKEESSKLVLVDGIPEDIYMVMCEKYTDMHQFVIAYNPLKQTALVNKKHIRQFEKRVLEVKSMQKDALVIPDDHKHFVFNQTVEAHQANNVICVYQPDQSSVTVFGTDQTCIKEEIHKLKLKAHMIETTNRAKRELTTSFQAPMSPDPDDSWTMISSISDTDQSWNEHGQTTEKTGTQPGGARPKDQFARGPVGKAGSSIETFHTNEGIPVYVYKQDILKVNTDCIVNAANDTLKHGGGIARVISKAAGFSLDKECSDHIKTYGKLKTGKIYASNAGKLQYKCVIHAIGPCWSDYIPHTHKQVEQCKRDLQDAVFNSLMAAEKKGLGSIAIPAISSAIFAVPEEICTSMYAKGVIAYSKQAKPSTRLKEIHFVDSFSHIVSKIQQRFRFTDVGIPSLDEKDAILVK